MLLRKKLKLSFPSLPFKQCCAFLLLMQKRLQSLGEAGLLQAQVIKVWTNPVTPLSLGPPSGQYRHLEEGRGNRVCVQFRAETLSGWGFLPKIKARSNAKSLPKSNWLPWPEQQQQKCVQTTLNALRVWLPDTPQKMVPGWQYQHHHGNLLKM